MDTTIDQQVAMDEAFVPHAQRLRIRRSNFLLLSDIKSKESTLQLVYDVLRLCPFFKAFLVTTDVPEIYMQEFWATITVHHHAIRFKIDNKKHIVNLESFRDMLYICLRVHGQSFVELPFEGEILTFIRFLRHSAVIKKLTDVNINKLYQPWRSFAAIINKCLTEKSSGYDSLRLSQAQILWGLYHKRNVDYAYLVWKDFVYQVKHKVSKKSNEMYYPRFTKVIIYHFMSKDPSIPRRNKVNWHYVRDDHMFSTIKLVSRHQNEQQFSALLPIELTNEDIKNSNAYQEYYAVSTGVTPPKPKDSNSTDEEGDDDEGKDGNGDEKDDGDDGEEGNGDDDDEDDDGEEGDDDDDDQEVERDDEKDDEEEGGDDEQEYNEQEYDEETRDEERFDSIPKTPENSDDEGNGEVDLRLKVGREGGHDEEEEEDELYRDVNINQGRGIQTTLEVEDSHVKLTAVNPDGPQQSSLVSSQFMTSMLNPTLDVGMEFIFETTSPMGAQTPTSVAPLPMSAPTITPSTIATITMTQQAPLPPTTALSNLIQDLPNFGSLFGFDNRMITLEANLSEFMQTNQFARASDKLREEAQKENDEFLKTIDENMQKVIKEKVKEQVKEQVSKILPRIEQTVNEQLEAEVLARSSNSSKTSYDVVVDLSKIELKKILIEKMEGNKEGKEPESASAPTKTTTRSAGRSTQGTKSRHASESESATIEEPMHTTFHMEEPSHPEFNIGYDKHALWGVSYGGHKCQQFYSFAVNRESARDVYSKRRIIDVTNLNIVEWHNYKHLDWITVQRDDDKLYKFKEGDFKRLHIQDIEDMLLLLVQGKLTNLTVEEHFAFNVSVRMFTRSIMIQRRVEDLQLGVKSDQKKLNLTKPDTYRSDLKRKEAYTAYSNLRGFMQYLPQSIWRKSDKDRAAAMIQAMDKRLKTRRIMRSLERFVRGRLYEGDFRMLQRTI
uniref:Monodehydroascorbate reductase n=1 Tax=Tanacetum cinerariifolium TaxID=118510 RepID=A0A699IHX4_TANCI|nr:hypothetical protein [Tanacetum cinerariifolium]